VDQEALAQWGLSRQKQIVDERNVEIPRQVWFSVASYQHSPKTRNVCCIHMCICVGDLLTGPSGLKNPAAVTL
jgi:hypothetical protein